MHSTPVGETSPALVVDLDRSLVRTDLLHEGLLLLAARTPGNLPAVLRSLLQGKAAFKRRVFDAVSLRPELLPYDPRVLEELRQAVDAGRPVILATANDHRVAESVARHLGVFDDVLATDGENNLKGSRKEAAIREHLDGRPFDYIGDSLSDIPVWAVARQAIFAGRSGRVLGKLRDGHSDVRVLPLESGRLGSWLKAIRPHQWLKNLLLLVPLLTAHRLGDPGAVLVAATAFVAWSLCASAFYIFNDLFDIESDRQHPEKRHRPLASGDILAMPAAAAAILLLAIAFALAIAVNGAFSLALAAYCLLNVAYTTWLKRKIMVDVLVLSAFYTVRVLAGALAIEVAVSSWLLAFSVFLFFSLALVKRCAELFNIALRGDAKTAGRGYWDSDLVSLQIMGIASGFIAVLVMALYIESEEVSSTYAQPELLWLVCPFLLYWIARIWMLTTRGKMAEDPIVFTAKDRVSRLVVLCIVIISMASFLNWDGLALLRAGHEALNSY